VAEARNTHFPIERIDEDMWEVAMEGNKHRFGSLEEG